ncbi:MAG: M23 family peptidase, partial [Alphaproteobacteria bacterium]|nr:M23 family peptidase [Alphaproteobacteria bacterium]
INSSLYETGIDGGLPPALINELINAYSYDVDFQREIKKGDVMDVLYERIQTKDGKSVGNGNVVFANLELGDRTLKIYRYVGKDGTADYYNEKGESVRKALLRTPINGAKITSGFGMRNHPILGYSKMHRGVDFGAPTGTPIYAAGDGAVEFVGVKGGYGNYVKLKHNNQYSSAYAHVSRFAAGISPGKKVKQGQIIAYVGTTGASTGPHLHYEIMAKNEQVNPANVKFKTGNVLAGKDLLAFRATMQKVEKQLAAMPRGGVVAMAESSANTTSF